MMADTVALASPVRWAKPARLAEPLSRRERSTRAVFSRRSRSVAAGAPFEDDVIASEPRSAADAVQVLQRQLVQVLERHAALAQLLRVGQLGLLERLPPLPGVQGGHGQLVEAGGRERLLHLGVGPERADLLAQDEVVAHAGRGADPHPGV